MDVPSAPFYFPIDERPQRFKEVVPADVEGPVHAAACYRLQGGDEPPALREAVLEGETRLLDVLLGHEARFGHLVEGGLPRGEVLDNAVEVGQVGRASLQKGYQKARPVSV